MDLVLTSLEAWDAVWRRNQHLVAGLLRRDPDLRVLFVEPPTDPLHAASVGTRPRRGRGLRRGPGLSGIRPDQLFLFEPTKWLPRRIDSGVDERWARMVLRTARTLSMHDPLLWVNDPTGAHLVAATTWPSLYDVTDDWTLAERTPEEHARLQADEALLLDRVAEVVVCSPALAASKGATREVTLVPNGVDSAAYRHAHPRPADLPPGGVALYVGTLHPDRLDLELCAGTSAALSDSGRLVLVGPDALRPAQRARLEAAGVLVLGARDRTLVPAYLQNADVLVVPHVVTAFTDSLDPIKLYEYAAAGRPVVSTPVAGFRDVDHPMVVTADGQSFVDTVRGLVHRRGEPAGRAPRGDGAWAPDDYDWSHRVAQMAAVIERVRPASSPGPTQQEPT